ncbi:V-type ATPase subunit [Candidatus Desantisbacteria bacterium]|nr:V-type ATPase subunit [Candidatus Desantisbacteria bacterium]
MRNNQSSMQIENYGYVNARIRGMKSLLISKNFYEDLLKASDFPGLVNLLEKTNYKLEVEECAISHSGVEGIDEALKRNLSRTFRKILGFVGDEPRNLILLFLGRWDMHNIITILRGIHISAPSDQILESLIPAGQLDMPVLNQLASETTIKGFIDILATLGIPYAKVLNDKYPEYSKEKNLSILELSLHKAYYQYALSNLDRMNMNYKIMKNIISQEIDALNIITILRLQKVNIEDFIKKSEEKLDKKTKNLKDLKKPSKSLSIRLKSLWGKFFASDDVYKKADIMQEVRNLAGIKRRVSQASLPKTQEAKKEYEKRRECVKEFYVSGGKEISEDYFIDLCLTLDVEKVVKDLEKTSFGPILENALGRYIEYNNISILERKLEEQITKNGINVTYKGPLYIGVAIGYIWKKYNEIVNLRIIVRCKSVGMPDRKIREELVLV